jgi:hypothetical protein
MMDLVVDHVEEQIGRAPLILTEGLDRLVKTFRWDLFPERVDLRRGVVLLSQ